MQKQKRKGPGRPGPRPPPKPATNHKPNKQHNQKRAKELSRSKLAATEMEIQELRTKYAEIDANSIERFAQFPLSQKTQKALAEYKYTTPTEVQRQSIGHALQGKDVLGAAITGSGKTLAFLIPVSAAGLN